MVNGLRSVLFMLITLGAALAGCASQSPATTDSVPAQDFASAHGAVPLDPVAAANVTTGSSFLMAGSSGPDGGLTGFEWQAPNGSLVQDQYFEDWYWLSLDVVPVGDTPSDWTLYTFLDQSGTWFPQSIQIFSPLHAVSKLAVQGTPQDIPSTAEPFFLTLGPFPSDEAPHLGFILAATSDNQTDFGMAFSVLDHKPAYDESPSDSLAALTGNSTGLLSVPVAGNGTGFQNAVYLDVNALAAIGVEAWTDSVQVEDGLPVDARPMATVRDVTLSSHYDQDGWSYGVGAYLGYESHGTWSASVDAQGQTLEANSIIAQDWLITDAFFAELIAFGLPIYTITGDGTGGSDGSFHVMVADVNYVDLTTYLQLDLGAHVSDLLGEGGVYQDSFVFTGLLGNVPPAEFQVEDGAFTMSGQTGPTLTVHSPVFQTE